MENLTNIDTLWILLCAFLVFLMQFGFSLIETGSVRAKNTINVAMKNLIDTVFGIIFFWIIGFGLMFGTDSYGLFGVDLFAIDGTNLSLSTLFFFQAMFATTAVTIISGAVAERMKFNGYVVVAIVVTSFIYPIFGHWAWHENGWLKALGFTDFAGSTVVHSLGAWIGLVGAVFLGQRLGKFSKGEVKYFAPNNHNLIVFGIFVLIFAWFGFNAGSLLEFNATTSLILLNTLVGAAFGGLGGWIVSLFAKQKTDVEIFAYGVLAGLVGITAGCNQFTIHEAAFVGLIASFIMYGSNAILLHKFKVDDPLSVVAIHGFAGVWGTLAVGIFGTPPLELSRLEFIGVQTLGVIIAFLLAVVSAGVLFYLLYRLGLLRVSKKHEVLGLNVSEHNAKLPWVDTIESIVTIMKTGNFGKKIHEERGTEVGLVAKFFNYLLGLLRNEQIELKTMNKKLQTEAHIDPLTKIMNRRGLMAEIKGKDLYKKNLSITIIDIDKFKSINDTYGHNIGDSVLKELSQIVADNIRQDDLFARWGGEEFVIVMFDNSPSLIYRIADKLRQAIESYDFETVHNVTASFGISMIKNQSETFDNIFSQSDQALYEAKKSGRNRVCVFK